MKKKLLLALSFITSIIYSQDIQFWYGEKQYIPAKLIYENGKILTGEILDFNCPLDIEIYDPIKLNFDKFEEIHHAYKRNNIEFRESANNKSINIKSDSLIQIQYLNNEIYGQITFNRVKFYKLKKDGTLKETNDFLFLPLIKSDKINFYGYGIVNKNTLYSCMMYIQNNSNNKVFCLNDINLIDFFNYKKNFQLNFKNCFKALNPNCYEFNKYIDSLNLDEFGNLSEYKQKEKEFRNEAKKLKTKNDRNQFVTHKLLTEYYYPKFEKLFQKFLELNCN